MLSPRSGIVSVCGLDPQTPGNDFKQEIGAVLQATALPDKLRVGEAVSMFASFYKRRRDPTCPPFQPVACDLFVSECSLPTGMNVPGHLTPELCGDLAAATAPKHLALTHFYPPVEHVDIRAIVGGRYAGPITLASDGWSFEIEDE